MATLTVHPRQGEPFLAWRDGAPLFIHTLGAVQAVGAGPFLLTPEGPEVEPGWSSPRAAAVLLREMFWPCAIEADPPLLPRRPDEV